MAPSARVCGPHRRPLLCLCVVLKVVAMFTMVSIGRLHGLQGNATAVDHREAAPHATHVNQTRRAPAMAPEDGTCRARAHTEYEGPVVIWGGSQRLETAAECCKVCKDHPECKLWVFCETAEGCNGRPFGECWCARAPPVDRERPAAHPHRSCGTRGKGMAKGATAIPLRASYPTCPWTSGAVLTAEEGAVVDRAEREAAAALARRRSRPGNPRVFFDVSINGTRAGRVEFVLYMDEAPRASENFRWLATGEQGTSFKGMRMYRIIDSFIVQGGVPTTKWRGAYDDDPGGLKLRHDRPGLLSAANSGPDTNTGHFSIVVNPAPHLDGSYTIFGEVVSGMDVVMAMNALAVKGHDRPRGDAIVEACGCLAGCDPRPSITPRCTRRAEEKAKVQGRLVRPCVD